MSDDIGIEIPLMEDVEEVAKTDLEQLLPEEETRDAFLGFVKREIEEIEGGSERELLLDNLKTWRRQRLARPAQAQKNTPWERAANTAPPLAATSTNTIYGTFKRAYEKKRPLLQALATDRRLQKAVDACAKLVNGVLESKFHIDFRTKNRRILYDTISLGTGVLVVPWRKDRRMFLRKSGDAYESVASMVYNAPDVVYVPRENLLIRSYYDDLQKAPFVGVKWLLTENELRSRAESGYYQNVEDVLERGREDDIPDYSREELERSVGTPDLSGDLDLFAVYECYAFWQGPEGYVTDFRVWYNLNSETVLRIEPNQLGVRELVRLPFWDIPGMFDGIGVGWMSQYAQEETETLHNMLLNSLHISSLQMYVTRRGAMPDNADQGMSFYPLKNIEVDGDPRSEFLPISFPSIGSEVFQAEQLVRMLNDRFVGSSDARMGFSDTIAKSGASPSMMAQQLQQGNVILEAVGESLDDGYAQMGTLILMQIAAHFDEAEEQLKSLVDESEWELIREVFSEGVEALPNKLKLSVITTPPEQTEAAKRQALTVLVELYTMYSQQLYGDLQMALSEQLPPDIREFAMKFVVGKTEIMEQVLKMYGEKDPETYLPYVDHMDLLLEHMEAMKRQQVETMGGEVDDTRGSAGGGQMGPVGGGASGPGGSPGVGGMEAPQEGAPPAGGSGSVPIGRF